MEIDDDARTMFAAMLDDKHREEIQVVADLAALQLSAEELAADPHFGSLIRRPENGAPAPVLRAILAEARIRGVLPDPQSREPMAAMLAEGYYIRWPIATPAPVGSGTT